MLLKNTPILLCSIFGACLLLQSCKEDSLLLDQKDLECFEANKYKPIIRISGKMAEGANIKLSVGKESIMPTGGKNPPGSNNFYWKIPNGPDVKGSEIILNNLSAEDAGDYTVFVERNGCVIQGQTLTVTVSPIAHKCNISQNNWAAVTNYSSNYDNMQYSRTDHSESGSGHLILPYSANITVPKIIIGLNQPGAPEGEYTLTSEIPLPAPNQGKYAVLQVGTNTPYILRNYTSGILVIKKNNAGVKELTICNEPVGRDASASSRPFNMKLILD